MNTALNEQIAPEIAQAIIAQATASGLSVNDYLARLLELALTNGLPQELALAEAPQEPIEELFDELSGVVDSRAPDPSSPPRPTLFGQLLTEEFRKQGLKFS